MLKQSNMYYFTFLTCPSSLYAWEESLSTFSYIRGFLEEIPWRLANAYVTQGCFSESIFSYLFKKGKVKGFLLSLESTSLLVVSNVNPLLYSFLNFLYSPVVWLPTRKTEKSDTTKGPYYMLTILLKRVFPTSSLGHITKSELKSFITQVSL